MDFVAKRLWRVGLFGGSEIVMGMMLVLAPGAGAQTPSNCAPIQDAQGNMTSNPACPNATSGSAPPVSAGQRFPYPGETPKENAPGANGQTAPSAPAPQGAAARGAGQGGNQSVDTTEPAAKRFPFPGESEAPPAGSAPVPGQPPLSDAGSSGSSSSSSSSSGSGSSGAPGSSDSAGGSSSSGASRAGGDPDTDPDAAAAPRRNRHKLPAVPRQSPSEREEEDVKVAGFYQNDGNYKGAYDRAKDAVSLDGDDPAAQLALAESARHLGKLDEAEKAYRQCLELDPVPKVRKKAEQALKDMMGGS